MNNIHENNTTATKLIDADGLPKTVFEREAEPLGLSLCKGPQGISLCQNGQLIDVMDTFPSHYVQAAQKHTARFAQVWFVPTSSDQCTQGGLLRQLYEAFGTVAYRIQFRNKKCSISQFTWKLNRYFLNLDEHLDDPHNFGLVSLPPWRKKLGVGADEIEQFRAIAKSAACHAVDHDETGPALYEAVSWLTYLDKLAQNPHRQKDAKVFSEFIVRKVAERAEVRA